MLKNKKCFLCFIILIVFLSGLTIVSATENNTDAMTNTISGDGAVTTTNDNIVLHDEKEETTYDEYKEVNTTTKSVTKQDTTNTDTKTSTNTVANYDELINAVNSAKTSNDASYTISLLPGNYTATGNMIWGDATGSTRKLIINGNGITLDGQEIYQFMKVNTGYTLELEHIAFTRFNATHGGVIYNGGTVKVTDTNYTSNNGRYFGGAIYNSGSITVNASRFIKNNGTFYGGAIYNPGNLTVINSYFADNNENFFGGAIYNLGRANITTSLFYNNTARNGSAVYNTNASTLTISNSNFTFNKASNYAAVYNNGTITVDNSNFINNTAKSSGAIYGERGSVQVRYSNFTGNNRENFIVQNRKILLVENDNYISLATVSVYLDDSDIPVYSGSLSDYEVDKGHNIRIVFSSRWNTITNLGYDLGMVAWDSISHNYAQLVEAVEAAKTFEEDSLTIGLLPGDYNATANMIWGDATGGVRKLIIEGNGITLDGNDEYQFMKICESYSLELNNITLTKYVAENGGVIYNEKGTLIITDSKLNNNIATEYGGAIYNDYGVQAVIINTELIYNTAQRIGGAICNDHTLLIIESSRLNNNYAKGNGGAIENSGNLTIINSFFEENSAKYGGALLGGLQNISNSKFIENYADRGGAIYNTYDCSVRTCEFIENHATLRGGVIYNENKKINITYSNFTRNNGGKFGYIIDNSHGIYYTTNSIFTDNTEKNYVIRRNNHIELVRSDFYTSDNVSIYLDDNEPCVFTGLLDDYTIPESYNKIRLVTNSNNSSSYNNMFVLNAIKYDSTVHNYDELVEAVEYAKRADDDYYIYLDTGNYDATANMTLGETFGVIRKLTIINNGGNTLNGKNLYQFMTVKEGYTLEIKNTTFRNFRAINGSVFYNNGGTVILNGTNLYNNYAIDSGGVIYNDGGNVSLIGGFGYKNVAYNSASKYGGLIANIGDGTITVSDYFIHHNSADSGGVIFNNLNGMVSIKDCYLECNDATNGGVIFTNGSPTIIDYQDSYYFEYHNALINITDSHFIENTASYGGAIYNLASKVEVFCSEFTINSADIDGGAIYVYGKTNPILRPVGSSYSDLYSPTNAANMSLSSCTFTKNVAHNNGGAICHLGGDIDINDSYMGSNTADNYGGAIYTNGHNDIVYYDSILGHVFGILNSASNLNINNSNLIVNIAHNDGGAIYDIGGHLRIDSSKIESNSADNDGGAIYSKSYILIKRKGTLYKEVYSGADVRLTDSTFVNNSAANCGGAISNVDGNIYANGSNFTDNTAGNCGGVIYNNITATMKRYSMEYDINATLYYHEPTIKLNKSKFTNNSAGNGGVMHSTGGNVNVTDSIFEGNSASDTGGAIYHDNSLLIKAYNETSLERTCIFADNQFYGFSVESPAAEQIQSIPNLGLHIKNSSFINNSAKHSGAIYNNHGGSSVIDSYFKDNTPANLARHDIRIALINTDGFMNVSNITVMDFGSPAYIGHLDEYPAVLYGNVYVTMVIDGEDTNTFKNNTFDIPIYYDYFVYNYTELYEAIEYAKTMPDDIIISLVPGDYNATCPLNWSNARTNTHKVSIEGNGLTLEGLDDYYFITVGSGHTLIMNNITISGHSYSHGTVIYNMGNVSITSSNFVNNHVFYDSGGVIINFEGGIINISDSRFENNSAQLGGGVIDSQNGSININNCVFIHNYADYGGVIFNEGGMIFVTDSIFVKNYANSSGVIYSQRGLMSVTGSNLTDNYAKVEGGVLSNYGQLTINDSNFLNNRITSGDGYGGAITNGGNIVISNSNFTNNSAYRGGAIFNNNMLNVSGSNFIANNASVSSAIYNGNSFYFDGIVNAFDNVFINNGPFNFALGVNSTLQLENDDNYIPGNAVVNITVNEDSQICEMTDRVVTDYCAPKGTYKAYAVINPSSSDNFRNNMYAFDIVNTLSISVDEIISDYRNINVPVNFNTSTKGGRINISINGRNVGTGNVDAVCDSFLVNIDVRDYPAGIYTLDITFTDDLTGYETETTSVLQLLPTKGVLQVNIINSTLDNVTLEISVTDITGTVNNSYSDGEIIIVDSEGYTVLRGQLTDGLSIVKLKRLDYTLTDTVLTVYYGGDAMLGACNASTQSIIYLLRDTAISIISMNNIYKNTVVKVQVIDSVTGKYVTSGSLEVTTPDGIIANAVMSSDGTCSIPVDLDNKDYTLTATYKGNDYYNPSSTTADISVTATTSIQADVISNVFNKTQINITVYDNITSTPINDAMVEIIVDGESAINHDTSITFNPTLTLGEHIITINYPETHTTNNYQNSTKTIHITISEDLEEIIENLEETISNQSQTINELNNNITSLKNTINALNASLESNITALSEAQSTINNLNNNITQLNNDIGDLNSQIDSLTEGLNNNISALNDAQDSINNLTNQINNQTQQIAELENDIRRLNNSLNANITALNEAQIEIERLEQELESNPTELAEALATIDALNQTIKELNDNITSLKNNINTLNTSLESNITALSEAQNNIVALNDNITQLNNDIGDLNSQIDTLTEGLNNNISALNDAQDSINNLTNQINNQTQQIAELENNIRTLNNSLNANITALDDAQKNIVALNDNITQLNNVIGDLNTQIDTLTEELNNNISALNRSQETVNNLTEQINNLTSQIDELNEMLGNVTQANDELVQELNDTIKGLTEEKDLLNEQLYNQTQQMAELENNIRTLNNSLNANITALNDAQNIIVALNDNITQLNNVIGDLNSQVDTLTEELSNNISALNRSQETVNNLTEQINNLTSQIDELNEMLENINQANDELVQELNDTIKGLTEEKYLLNEQLYNQTQQMAELENNIRTLNNSLNANITALNDAQNNIVALNDNITQLNNVIGDLNSQVDTLTEELNNNISALNKSQDTVNNLTEQLNNQNVLINELNNTVNSQLSTIENLTSQIEEQAGTINALNNTLNSQNATIENLTVVVEEQNSRIYDLTQQNNATQEQLNNITQQNNELKEQVEALTELINSLTAAKETVITIDSVSGVKVGDNVTITGTLLDVGGNGVAGVVKLLINGGRATVRSDASGLFTYNYVVSKVGTNNVTASYMGTDKYNSSTTDMVFDVAMQDTCIVFDEIMQVKTGNDVTVTGKLLDANGNAITGTIKLLINNGHATVKTDDNGVFTCTFKVSKVGINNITATFNGNTKYLETNATTTFEVIAKDTQIIFDGIASVKKGDQITISGKLLDEYGNVVVGTIKLLINGGRVTVKTDENGIFSYNYTVTKVGTLEIQARYLGANRYTATNATTSVEVAKLATTITLNNIGSVKQKTLTTISGKLADEKDNAITGTIKLLINSGRATVKTDVNGVFTYTFNATKAGQNIITASYIESTNYLATNSTIDFTVEKV